MEYSMRSKEANGMDRLAEERSCIRCRGLLVSDWFYDLKNPVEYNVKVLRCVQCGHRVDPTIVRNRIHPPVPDLEEGLGYQHSVSTEHVEDAAF